MALGDFIPDGGSLFADKVGSQPLPEGGNAINFARAADLNQVKEALLDLRTHTTGVVNVLDYGADPTGVADSTAAIQAAVDFAATSAPSPKPVLFVGELKVSSTITAANEKRITWYGSKGARLVPADALEGLPVIKWTNVRDSTIRDLSIEGNQFHPPSSGIEFSSAAIVSEVSTGNLVENVQIGSSYTGLVHGIVLSAGVGEDHNNDLHAFRSVRIFNVTGSGYRIEHSNSLANRIEGGMVAGADVGVQALSGSFNAHGLWLRVTTREYEIGAGTGTLYHAFTIADCRSEDTDGGTTPTILYVSSAQDDANVTLHNYGRRGSVASKTLIDFQSADGRLTISGSVFDTGQIGQTLSVSGAGSSLRLIGNPGLGFNTVSGVGTLVDVGNVWSNGTPTISGWASIYRAASAGAFAGQLRAADVIATTGSFQGLASAQNGPPLNAGSPQFFNIGANAGNVFSLNVNNGDPWKINNPSSPVGNGQTITLRVRNTSAGVLGAATFDTSYKLAGAWVNPAAGQNRTIQFAYDSGTWYEVARSAADAPN